ncbi:MAG: hypothetical protein AB2552_17535 [Candidatus Thiodiazotropha endolucinida]
MFFKSKKKIAEEITVGVLNQFKPAFLYSKYIEKDGFFIPPKGFWTDNYIIGFTHQLILLSLDYDFNGKAMSVQKRGDIILMALQLICEDDWPLAIHSANNNFPKAEHDQDKEFARGSNDAATMYGAAIGRLKPDDPDPILKQAYSLASSMGPSYTSLVGAILILTITKHIKESFIKDNEE